MGADIKTLRSGIKSVNSTLHLTKAMGLVASSKIRRANEEMQKSKAYENHIKELIKKVASSQDCRTSPFLRNEGDRTKLILIAGDRGLAGGYNANVFRLAADFNAEIIPIGYRACDRFGKSRISSEHFTLTDAYDLSVKLCDEFIKNEYDRLGIICTKYVSALSQEALVKWIFPLEKTDEKTQMLFEPNASFVLNEAVKEYLSGALFESVKESFASETAARRTAMDSAEKNARGMLENLQTEYNRARQGAITQEITEIVSGSGA